MEMSLGTQGVGDGQGSLACCDSWGRKETDTRALDFDIGKATSLWRGGWKLSKIADEMHCAPQTVANYLERAGVIKKKENVNASNTADV